MNLVKSQVRKTQKKITEFDDFVMINYHKKIRMIIFIIQTYL